MEQKEIKEYVLKKNPNLTKDYIANGDVILDIISKLMHYHFKELSQLKEKNKELEEFIITGETKKTIYLSDGTVRLPKNYTGVEG